MAREKRSAFRSERFLSYFKIHYKSSHPNLPMQNLGVDNRWSKNLSARADKLSIEQGCKSC